MKYVVGLAFNEAHTKVLLQLKRRGPVFNIGWLNGPGGKVEQDPTPENPRYESCVQGMVREFREETGLVSTKDDWMSFHYERHTNGKELFFYTTDKLDIMEARSVTDETNCIVELGHVRSYEWKFPMGYLWCRNEDLVSFTAQEINDHIDTQTRKRGGLTFNMTYLIPMALSYLRHPEHRYLEG